MLRESCTRSSGTTWEIHYHGSASRDRAGIARCGGVSTEEIMDEYDLEKEDILAAIEYAAKIVAKEEITAWYVYDTLFFRCRYASFQC